MVVNESGFADFLAELFRNSRVSVGPLEELTREEREAAARTLSEFEMLSRAELPLTPPPISPETACASRTTSRIRWLRSRAEAIWLSPTAPSARSSK